MTYIITSCDRPFHFDDPIFPWSPEDEIATALSKICRFTGHTRWFYSVAEHSVHCSYLVPPEFQLEALLHDASEAYVGDMSQPLKSLLPQYKEIEARVEAALRKHYKLPPTMSPEVHYADLQMLKVEKYQALDTTDEWVFLNDVDLPLRELQFWTPEVAYNKFMDRYYDLTA